MTAAHTLTRAEERYVLPELRPWVWPWMKGYQRQAVCKMVGRGNGLLWWPCGCLAGSTKITVNRGGKAFVVRLDSLVAKFNGGAVRNPRNGRVHSWDTTIPTRTASVDGEGYLCLNQIVAAVDSGVKPVWRLRAEKDGWQREVVATEDHRFRDDTGTWLPLSALRPGDGVMVRAKAGGSVQPPRRSYKLIHQMWNHPHACRIEQPRSNRPGGMSRTATVPEHRLVVEAHLNGVSVPELVGLVVLGLTDGLTFLDPAEIHVHHKNRDVRDNRLDNLEALPVEEHRAKHGRDDTWRNATDREEPWRVTSIEELPPEPTYDLTMADPHNSFVADGFVVHNSGKTVAAVTWALAFPSPVLVVCRANARRQWASEVRRFSFVEPYVVLPVGERKKGYETLEQYRQRCWAFGRRPFVIIGWPSLAEKWEVERPGRTPVEVRDLNREIDNFVQANPPSVIWDEHHALKDHKRYNRIAKDDGGFRYEKRATVAAVGAFLSKRVRRRLGLTATPIPDRLRDLWGQLDTAEPGCAGKYWDWAAVYCDAFESINAMDDQGAANIPQLQAFCAVRAHVVTTEQVEAEMPPMRRTTTFLGAGTLTNADRDAVNAVRRAARAVGGGDGLGGGGTTLLEARLMATAARKDRHVVDTVEDCIASGQKVLVFTGRRKDVDRLRVKIINRLQKRFPAGKAGKGAGWKLWAAHGEVPAEERGVIRELYMAHTGPACIVGTGAAWGESLNLQDTDRLMIVMLPWTWGQIRQWEGRVRRLGGKPCLIEYLVAEGTVDERVASVVLEKLSAVEKLLPDEQVTGVRETLQGGSDDEVIGGLLDRMLED